MSRSLSSVRKPVRRRGLQLRGRGGFTLIELLTVLTMMGGLAALATGRTRMAIEQAKFAKAIGDIRSISADIVAYQGAGNTLPAGLSDVDRAGMLDPWGRPYRYVDLTSGGTPRTDVFGIALNTEFDVYSDGPDGASATSLASAASQDDIVRANDGGYIGKGSRY
ncbi:MAG: type II secretion system protein [Gemmatimonadales bacterium]